MLEGYTSSTDFDAVKLCSKVIKDTAASPTISSAPDANGECKVAKPEDLRYVLVR